MIFLKLEWYPLYGPKSLFKFGEKRPIVCCCTHEQKMNFEGYSKWLLWQPVTAFGAFIWYHRRQQPLPFYKTRFDFQTSISCRFLFSLFNKLKFWQLVLVFSALYRLYLQITLFCTKPSEQIVYCHVTDVKMLKKFSLLNNDTIGLWLPQISGIYL